VLKSRSGEKPYLARMTSRASEYRAHACESMKSRRTGFFLEILPVWSFRAFPTGFARCRATSRHPHGNQIAVDQIAKEILALND
jgi:hypothetical protein